MEWRVVVRPRAESDLREARNWYQGQRAGLGDEFIAEIAVTIRFLAEDPELRPDIIVAFAEYWRGAFPIRYFTEWKASGL